MRRRHAMPFGTEMRADVGTRFRLWAPGAGEVELQLEGGVPRRYKMQPAGEGWHELLLPDAGAGTLYRFRIDGGMPVPDPASRFQPQDVHGPSEVIDPAAFHWHDGGWRGRPWEEAVTYELHVGAFTAAGSYAGLAAKLDHLADLGVTAIELMPLSDTPGRRNWGYDGVYHFAPEATYGRPEDLKALVETAHRRGLMVFLDVVYNHFGPEGNYLHLSAPRFFTERHSTPWGAAINFDGGLRPVRDFFIHNALYWLEEYHLDGLRLDAVHAIRDDSRPDILLELAERVQRTIPDRPVHLVLENDANASRYLARREDGRPRSYVAQWNDDFHHALHVTLTGEADGYYGDYAQAPLRHLGRTLTEGFAFQGEASAHRGGAARGEPSADLPAAAFVNFLQNHDQIGNRAFGDRIAALAAPEALRAGVAVLLLAPSPPLLFMGEEWGATQPFPFFCDFGAELAAAVREGRRREFAKFPAFLDEAAQQRIPDATAPETFAAAVLDWQAAERPEGQAWLAFYRRLLTLRRQEIVPRLAGLRGGSAQFTLHGEHALAAGWRLGDGSRLALCANLGPQALEEAPPAPPGRVLYRLAMPEGALQGRWPPWSVAWLLDAG